MNDSDEVMPFIGWGFINSIRRIPEAQYVCGVPVGLGNVTKLRSLNGRVVAETESGVPMIVPLGVRQP